MIPEDYLPSRRRVLFFAAALRLYASDSDFWNRKDPSHWTADEVDRLITKSPWAKEIATPGSGVARRGRKSASPQYSGVVRWESAKPVLEAMKASLPRNFSNHYVISVSGLPSPRNTRPVEGTGAEVRAAQRENEAVFERIKSLTYLAEVKPAIVEETPFGVGETRTILFGFSKALLPLSPDGHEIAFTTQLGTIPVKVKFGPKEMMYRGELAV